MGGILSRAPENLLWAILAVWFINPQFSEKRTIEIHDDRVEIKEGGDTIIISRETFDQLQNTKGNEKIERGVRRTFEALEKDEAITNFGITPELTDETPLVQIPREDFDRLAHWDTASTEDGRRRSQRARSIVVVLKPWVDASKHKWSFEWNGVPISAYVRDVEFLERVRDHEIRFGNGDALDVMIDFYQDYDENLGVWVNDTNSFVVEDVFVYIPKDGERVALK